jgi:hypothetical protein
MDMQGALRARLLAAATVTARVAQRVYWVDRPQATALPAITLQIIDEPRDQHMAGFQDLRQALVQVDAWAATYAEAAALKEAVITALVPAHSGDGVDFRRAFVRTRDLFERTETQAFHRASMDFTFSFAVQ